MPISAKRHGFGGGGSVIVEPREFLTSKYRARPFQREYKYDFMSRPLRVVTRRTPERTIITETHISPGLSVSPRTSPFESPYTSAGSHAHSTTTRTSSTTTRSSPVRISTTHTFVSI